MHEIKAIITIVHTLDLRQKIIKSLLGVIQKHWRKHTAYKYHLSRALTSDASLPAHAVACPECDSDVALPKVGNGQNAHCPTCGYQLVSIPYVPYFNPLAYTIASIVFMIMSVTFVFMGIKVGDASFNMTLPQAVSSLFRNDYQFLAYILLSTLLLTPLVLLLGCLYVYHALYFRINAPYLDKAINLIIRVKPWVMIDIFVISIFVSMVKIQDLAGMTFGYSFWAIVLLAVCILRTSIFIHPHWLFYQYKKLQQPDFKPLPSHNNQSCHHCFFYNKSDSTHCVICHHALHKRKPKSIQISLALLIAAVLLYFPANTFPMMITVTPFDINAANILEGIIYMWEHDAKFIGLVIFCASLMVPLIKMIAIVVLLVSVKYKLLAPPIVLTKLYRIIELIGRWSMVDIFVVTIMVTLVQLPGAFALPGKAVLYFCLVVLLSMIAVTEFDIRLVWDKEKRDKKQL